MIIKIMIKGRWKLEIPDYDGSQYQCLQEVERNPNRLIESGGVGHNFQYPCIDSDGEYLNG